ncbi:hypothetical protein Rsub_12824 [Raphidocelis subcapitata]|uniref:Methyltransferase domain-containing protein n=1 Tax=Raphidocelis subcapitata TaxID=307507 RepID=A0A2V0PJL8_9CHLO|nr:hypothetical protein Rsub_12824 [Raphidocelis subcapitata]|eukprot:GBF99916.1 hypothetical protein Rsub_12824 [Raphidocelis subcapitata]
MAVSQATRRTNRGGYIGTGNTPASQYHSADFDYAEHLRACAPLIEAQLAAALALRRAGVAAPAPEALGGRYDGGEAGGGEDGAPRLSARARRRLRNAELKAARAAERRAQAEQQQREAEAALSDRPAAEAEAAAALQADGQLQTEGGAWELFFQAHPSAKFFRERRYLALSFPSLGADAALEHIVELGAGCGSSILPLLKMHPRARATVCDVSATSLRQLLAAAAADGIAPSRIRAFVADATDPGLSARLAADPGDACLIMFTLSAVPPVGPRGMGAMLANAAASLRRGGRLCVRDHARGDLVQLRIPPQQVVFAADADGPDGGGGGSSSSSSSSSSSGRERSGGGGGSSSISSSSGGGGGGGGDGGGAVASEGSSGGGDGGADASRSASPLLDTRTGAFWYRRGDGTLAYFYTADELAAMGEAAGLAVERAEYACVVNANRRSGQELRRCFVTCEWFKR